MKSWTYRVGSFDKKHLHNLEALFTQMNGYLGIRGYAEEGIAGYDGIPETGSDAIGSSPQQFIAGYFDKSPVTRNTMVNLPTLRLTRITLDGEKLDPAKGALAGYERVLDMRDAVTRREFTWTSPKGRRTALTFVSFLSQARPHLLLTEITIKPLNWSGPVEIEEVFDGTGLTIGQRHFDITAHGALNAGLYCGIKTRTSKLDAAMASFWETLGTSGLTFGAASHEGWIVSHCLSFAATKGKASRLRRFVAVCTDFDRGAKGTAKARALRELAAAANAGWNKLRAEQSAAWRALWDRANITIAGDADRDFKLRYSIFQLLQAYRPGDSRLNIGAKFLSGDHYSGHYFWDTENFIFPFYLLTLPDYARHMLEYRVNNLPGAKIKAREHKFKGAFYPWEACPFDGRENCPTWWQDKAAKEPIFIPCGIIELHINTAVAMAASHFLAVGAGSRPAAKDIDRMLVEMARFWASRGTWEDGRFVIKNVIGPDEYHEHVDNNAYTNHTARWVIQRALEIASTASVAKALGITRKEIAEWQRVAGAIVEGYDTRHGILAQDDTFLDLEDVQPGRFKKGVPLFRQIDQNGLNKLKVIKQADVLALFHARPFDYDMALMQRCWDYYEPRTVHDSNLSAGTHAIVAHMLGRKDEAIKYLDMVLDLDIGNGSYNVAEGLHAANAGNAWGATVLGAAGVRWTGRELCCTPRLPAKWKSLTFPLVYRGRQMRWTITPKRVSVAIAKGKPVNLVVEGKLVRVPSKAVKLDISREAVGVIFDLDGVLVDSAVCHFHAWKAIAEELGVPFDEKRNDLLRGVSRRESLEILIDGHKTLTEEEITHYLHKKNELYKKLVDNAGDEILLPGVKPFLTRLRMAGIRLAVASSSKNTPALLRQAGLDHHYFDAIADGNDIRNSKPHPEVFLLAARRAGVKPSRCIAVEDAPAGVEAGIRAGMKTLGIGHADLKGCTWRRDSIAHTSTDDIFSWLGRMTAIA